jgi:hypothetical protein
VYVYVYMYHRQVIYSESTPEIEGEPIGVVQLTCTKKERFTEDDALMLGMLLPLFRGQLEKRRRAFAARRMLPCPA